VLRRRADDEVLRRVYREHVDAVFAFFAYSAGRQVAEDLTATTFEKVIRAWHRYDAAKAGERTWILAVARNVLTDNYRRERLRETMSTDEHPGLLELGEPVEWVQRRLEIDELRTWLAHLSDREREVLALRYGADLAAAEIGGLLGLSTDNVHQIVSRALRRLRERAGRSAAAS
jgi:RNA polymerase sigma-70 factor (ECF subfamily)